MPIYRKINAKQTLNRVKDPHMPFNWSINPYRGCFHGCSFCYARATHSFMGLQADDSFQNEIFMKKNAADALRKQLEKTVKQHHGNFRAAARKIGLVAVGTATDPYQPIEGKAKLTRQCLEVLGEFQIPASITTRSPLVLRDIDLLREINIVSVNVSISTLDHKICRTLEPGASYPGRRLEIVQTLVNHGIPAGIFMAPIVPHLTDSISDMDELIHEAGKHDAHFVSPSVLRLSPDVKKWFFHIIRAHYPQLLSSYMQLYEGAYPNKVYTDTLMKKVHRLLDRYGYLKASGDDKRVSEEQEPVRQEQLSFSF